MTLAFAPGAFDMPPVAAGYAARGRWLVARLMEQFSLSETDAAGIVGNLGFESHLTAIQEKAPIAGRGGFGWAQWTASRRVAFEAWCHAQSLDPASDEANYGYLLTELRGPYKNTVDKVRATSTLYDAVFSVGQTYERPFGTTATYLPGMDSRLSYAQQALGRNPDADVHLNRMKTMQTALHSLGLYDGAIDGLWGPKSRAAFDAFQREAK